MNLGFANSLRTLGSSERSCCGAVQLFHLGSEFSAVLGAMARCDLCKPNADAQPTLAVTRGMLEMWSIREPCGDFGCVGSLLWQSSNVQHQMRSPCGLGCGAVRNVCKDHSGSHSCWNCAGSEEIMQRSCRCFAWVLCQKLVQGYLRERAQIERPDV